MGNRFHFLCLLCSLVVFLTGCWDQVQIEERGFVIGVAIDKPPSKTIDANAEREAPNKPEGRHRVLVTHQLVIPGGLVGGGQGGGSQNSGEAAYLNLTSEGDSLFEISRILATRTSRSPFYQHLKVVIVSEELAKNVDVLSDALDFFMRDPEVRRSSKVMVAKGDARQVLKVQPRSEKLPAMYINSVAENIQKTARMLPEVRIGEVHEHLVSGSSFVLPRISPSQQEVKVAGSAVFQGATKRMVGYLGEEETEGLNFLTGKLAGGLLKVPVHDNLVTVNVLESTQDIRARAADKEHIHFRIEIECEGTIAESMEPLDFLDEKMIRNVEAAIAREILRISRDTVNKLHKDMKTDVLGLGNHLRQHDHSLWHQVKADWDTGRNYFSQSEIEVSARFYIRTIGDANRTQK